MMDSFLFWYWYCVIALMVGSVCGGTIIPAPVQVRLWFAVATGTLWPLTLLTAIITVIRKSE